MSETKIPARVAALAAQIGDEPLAWREQADGSITIVFCNKGKQTFEKEGEEEIPAFPEVIHNKEEAQLVVKTLPPKRRKV